MRFSLQLLFSIALFAVGCGGKPPIDKDWKSKAGVRVLGVRWVKRLSPPLPNFLIPELGEEHDRFNPVETASASFDLKKKRAFIGVSVGGMYCINMKNGKTVWRYGLSDSVGSAPLYSEERRAIFFGADDGTFYALHALSGRKLWQVDTGAEIRRKPILHADTMYIINADNTIFALDPDGGETIWQYRRPPIEGFSSSGYSGITLSGSNIIAGFSDGYVVAVDSVSGSVVWSNDLASEVATVAPDGTIELIDADATPIVINGIVVAASVAGGLQAFDAESGTVKWTRPEIKGVTGLAERDNLLFAARSSYGITALDSESGNVKWSKEFPTGVLQDPVLYKDILLVSDSEYGLYVVSTLNGELLQRLDPREGFFARPSVKGGYMLILGNRGTLFAMSIM